jgi:thymidylate kinase
MGQVIAVIGIDGSGKTSFINNLGFPTRHFYQKNSPAETKRIFKSKNVKAGKLKIFISSIVRFYIPNILFFFKYKVFSDKTVVFDRYSYDFHGRLENNHFLIKFLNYLFKRFPEPNYIIFLDVDPQVAKKRKDEHELNYLLRKRELLIEATRKLDNKKLIIIENNQDTLNGKSGFIKSIISKGLKYKQ